MKVGKIFKKKKSLKENNKKYKKLQKSIVALSIVQKDYCSINENIINRRMESKIKFNKIRYNMSLNEQESSSQVKQQINSSKKWLSHQYKEIKTFKTQTITTNKSQLDSFVHETFPFFGHSTTESNLSFFHHYGKLFKRFKGILIGFWSSCLK